MSQSPWKANTHSNGQQIPHLLRKAKIHYRVHKNLPMVLILFHMKPAPNPVSIRSILILSFYLRLGLASGLFPSRFPTKMLCTLLPPLEISNNFRSPQDILLNGFTSSSGRHVGTDEDLELKNSTMGRFMWSFMVSSELGIRQNYWETYSKLRGPRRSNC
jgi:hypothetical protein